MNAFAISLTVKSGIAVFNYAALFLPGTTGQCTATLFRATGLSRLVYERGRRMSSNKTENRLKNG